MIEDGPKTFMGPARFLDTGVFQRMRLVPVVTEIVSGAVSYLSSYMQIQGEGDAADTLTTINGGVHGSIVVIRKHGTGTLTVDDVADNINLAGDFAMNSTRDTLILMYIDVTNEWVELSRSNNV